MGNGDFLTERLRSLTQGDRASVNDVLEEIMPKLREIASRILMRERYEKPFQTMDLVHECWMRHLRKGGWEVEDRVHFFLMVARAMRQVLIDEARRSGAQKRGAREKSLSLADARELAADSGEDSLRSTRMLEINLLLEQLERNDPDAVRMIEANLLGCTVDEIAKETGLTSKQVRIRLQRGIKFLRTRLTLRATTPGSGLLGL